MNKATAVNRFQASMQPDEITETTKQKIWSKRTFLIVVVIPLLIAVLGALSPKLYEEFTKPKVTLSYRVLSGPAIGESGHFQQIFSISVVNSGKVPLVGVRTEIQTRGGQIDKLVVDQDSTVLHPTIESTATTYHISVDRMLPTETLNLSAMTTSSQIDPRVQVSVRSNEVRGILQEREAPSSTTTFSWVAAAALAFGIALLISAALYRVRERISEVRNVQTTKDFIENIGSRRHIMIRPVELNLTGAFPMVTQAARWDAVFDGKELCIVDVANLEIEGVQFQSKLLADPRYAFSETATILHYGTYPLVI